MLVGVSWNKITNKTSNQNFIGFEDENLTNIGNGTYVSGNETRESYGLNSYFGRLNYGYDDKIFINSYCKSGWVFEIWT